MEERPKSRLCLKLGQRKLSFQQKPSSSSKAQEEPSIQQAEASSNSNAKDEEITTREIPPLSGLCNLGNTCYVNSLLQPLRFCPQFSQWIEELHKLSEQVGAKAREHRDHQTDRTSAESLDTTGRRLSLNNGVVENEAMDCSKPCDQEKEKPPVGLATHLHMLWQRMGQKERAVVKPTNKVTVLSATKPDGFITKLKEENPLFNNKLQQDAQEMLRFLLTNLQETFASIMKESSSSLQLKDATFPPHAHRSSSEPYEVIDVDSYCEKNNSLHTVALNRKRKLSSSDNSARKTSKIVKLSKNMTCKKVTEFFSPVKGKSKSEERQPLQVVSNPQKKVQNDSSVKMRDFITDSFQGQLAYQTRCYECDGYTRRTEPFLDVSVPVTSTANILPGFPSEPSPRKTPTKSFFSATDVGPYSLSWALSQFALREKLRGDNKYFCDECGHFVEAERSVLFSHLSSVMTIHLNRFSTQLWGLSSAVTVSKVGGNLAIPLSLSFKPWCTSDCSSKDRIYQLFAVVFHSGSSCSSGHYTACIRGKECCQLAPQDAKERFNGNGWIYFDDDQLDYVSQSELLEMMSPLSNSASTVYILFYTCNV